MTLGLSIVVMLAWFVLPGVAGSSAPVPILPTSTTVGVTPQFLNVGGNFACSSVNSTATGSLSITNPRTGSTATVPGTSYKVTLGTTTSTITRWTATGGIRIVDVAVKGGEKTAWYRYRTAKVFYTPSKYASLFNGLTTNDGVTGDTKIHAPMKRDDDENENDLYSLSQMTFCYVIPNSTISGTVQRQGTSAAPAGTWSVQAYNASSNSALGAAVPVAANGSYAVTVPASTSVKLCVKTTSAVAWTQVDPSSGTTTCVGSGELPWGRTATSGAAATDTPGQNFVVTPTTAAIGGRVYQDAYPYNGQWASPSDTGLQLWTVTATSILGTYTGTTDADGSYSIDAPNGDSYTLCVTATPEPAGNWAPTGITPPAANADCQTTGSGGSSITSDTRSVASLASGGSTGNDFSFKHPNVTIQGSFWNDVDVNGLYDSSIDNDPTKADNWTITVNDGNGNSFTPTLTAATGSAAASYSIGVPGFATYTVCAAPVVANANAPWKQSAPTGNPDPQKCGTAGAKLPVGYTLPLQGTGASGNDFAGLEATGYTCGTSPPAGEQAFSVSCGDKWGSASASVFWLYSQWTGDDGKQNVLLDSQTPPQNAGTKVAYLEKITWTYTGNSQNALTMYFIDKSPWSPAYVSGAIAMRDCTWDPRGAGNQTSLAPIAPAANVIPSYAGDVPNGYVVGDYRSCILYKVVERPFVEGGSGTYTFYVYSEGDAYRSGY